MPGTGGGGAGREETAGRRWGSISRHDRIVGGGGGEGLVSPELDAAVSGGGRTERNKYAGMPG